MRKTAIDQNLTKKIKIDQRYLARSTSFLTFSEKRYILRSTHWQIYDPAKDVIGDSTDWGSYEWYKEAELLDAYPGHWWHRDV